MIGVAFGLTTLYLISRTRRLRAPLPPGPAGTFFFGNIRDLPPANMPEWRHWMKLKERYGSISSLTVLRQTIVIINDYRTAVQLLDERNINYSNRPVLHFAGEMYVVVILLFNKILFQYLLYLRVGWNLSFPLLMDTSRFRAYRKSLRRFMGTKSAITRFHSIQTIGIRRFLFRVLEDPEKLPEHFRTEASAIILKLSYGYSTEPRGPDPLIELAQKVTAQLSLAATPGKWLIDVIPACTSHISNTQMLLT